LKLAEAQRVTAREAFEDDWKRERDDAEHGRRGAFLGTAPEGGGDAVELVIGDGVAFAGGAEDVDVRRETARDGVHLPAKAVFVEFVAFGPRHDGSG